MDLLSADKPAPAGNPIPPSSPTTSHASSITSISSGHKTHGVQKFCSKIRHKIEDNIGPRLTGKLYKSQKHSISMTSLSNVDSTSGKYTTINKQSTLPSLPAKADSPTPTATSAHRRLTGMLKHQRQRISKSAKALNKCEISAPIGKVTTNSGIICPALLEKGGAPATASALATITPTSPTESATYVDSDDEYQLSLNLTKQSLEDEIFEELEKAAHDESKLNAVLKNFDRLLTDYHDKPAACAIEQSAQCVESDVAVVEAAAAAQLELLALEPPLGFADNEFDRHEISEGTSKTYLHEAETAADAEKKTMSGTVETILETAETPSPTKATKVFEYEKNIFSMQEHNACNKPSMIEAKDVSVTEKNSGNTNQVCSTITDSPLSVETSISSPKNSNNNTISTSATEDPITPPQRPARPKRLEKSKSSLAIPRRNVYQTPDTPTLRNVRYALATRARSKSVWELTPNSAAAAANSKIPIFKALPLQKRSNSFCSVSLTEMIGEKEKMVETRSSAEEWGGGNIIRKSAVVKDKPTVTNTQRRQLTKDARSASTLSLGTKTRSRSLSTTRAPASTQNMQAQQAVCTSTAQRSKRKTLPVEKLTRSNSRLQIERTKSSIGFNSVTLGTHSPRRTPSSTSLSSSSQYSSQSQSSSNSGSVSRVSVGSSAVARKLHRSRDELLDKCLEKGHEILRKVESINTKGGVRKAAIVTAPKNNGKTTMTTATKSSVSSQVRRANTAANATTLASARTKVKTAATGNTPLTGKITKDACAGTLRRIHATTATTRNATSSPPTATKQLKYANEEKVPQQQLEFCKIIPPVLGETSDKHAELLVNVVQFKSNAADACKTTAAQNEHLLKQREEVEEGEEVKVEAASNYAREQVARKIINAYQAPRHAEPIEKLIKVGVELNHHNNESDSDDSGHISNENDTNMHTLSTSTTSSVSLCESDIIEEEKIQQRPTATTPSSTHAKSNKISELLQKFEQQSNASAPATFGAGEHASTRSTPSKVCTATRVAKLEAVQCIQTQVEFYPTYSKEVTIRLL
ncbi:putative GPI-anchored protein pfl2 [Ceratitis capitata]|uniref:putative GPI-anchored protein pfl2 n=1 Tax=Ceratitis capitata TaxID=7213 RepID=UPI000618916B|nr:putative GPI-anchored protein pfl2 [Ceratitis capitata]